jgi:hypothetical protein
MSLTFSVTPAEAGVPLPLWQWKKSGIPAFAGMTGWAFQ